MNMLVYLTDEHALGQFFTQIPTPYLVISIIITIAILTKGADWMIDGAIDLAFHTGLPRILIGATILSLGTTAPEAFVSVTAAFMGNPGLALGNGVGSIIVDTGLIFGLTVIIARPSMDRWILDRAGRWQIGSALLLILLSGLATLINPVNPLIARWMGLILTAMLILYLYKSYVWATDRKNQMESVEPDVSQHSAKPLSVAGSLAFLFFGLLMVIIASRLLIPGASETARRIGVPEAVIAATMVAFGTSLPELVTAMTAIKKGQPEITIGNIIGADVLNSLFVVGLSAIAAPLEISRDFYFYHFPSLILILLAFRIFVASNRSGYFKRWQGVFLVAVYVIYLVVQYV